MTRISMTAIRQLSFQRDIIVFYGNSRAERLKQGGAGDEYPPGDFLGSWGASFFYFHAPEWRAYLELANAVAPQIQVIRDGKVIFRSTLQYAGRFSETFNEWSVDNDQALSNRRVVWAAMELVAVFLENNERPKADQDPVRIPEVAAQASPATVRERAGVS